MNLPTYRIVTLGCKLNQADSNAFESRLRRLGLRRAPDAEDAAVDLVVLNTCTVTGGADREARQIARRLRRAHPKAVLVATGCYAERDGADLARVRGVDHVVGMRDQAGRVAAIAAQALGLASPPEGTTEGFAAHDPDGRVAAPDLDLGRFGATDACDPATSDRTRAFLKVQDGCDLRCSYCVIPSVRGPGRSLPAEMVLDRLAGLARAGYHEVVLTGVNTGDWGADLEPRARLHDLLARALEAGTVARLRLNSLEPRTVTDRIAALMAESGGRLARHLQVPLQSGSDPVLARMRRNYRTADYARALERIGRAVPEAGLGADIIVGFPGESDAEFEATCRFVEASTLAYLHVFSYSARPGTDAAALPGQVPAAAVRERSARLRALGRDLSLRYRRRFVGRTLPALALRETRPDGRVRALTDTFIDCDVDPGPGEAGDLFNRLLTVRITSAEETRTLAEVA